MNEVYHSPLSSDEVKNECSYTSTAHPCLLHDMDRDDTLYNQSQTPRSG